MKIIKYILVPISLYAFAAFFAAFTTWSLEPFNPANWGPFFRYLFACITGIVWVAFCSIDLEGGL